MRAQRNYTLTSADAIKAMDIPSPNKINIIVDNYPNLYVRIEWLTNCCLKAYKRHSGLDLDYLENCATLKAITREARKIEKRCGGHASMQEDREAREALAVMIAKDVVDML